MLYVDKTLNLKFKEEEKRINEKYKEDSKNLGKKEAKRIKAISTSKLRRKKILTGDLIRVSIMICFPIALYGLFNSLYGLLDSIICSAISASSVTTVSALSQVKNALSAFGAGIAGGGAIIVARYYGAGRIEEAKKNSAVLFSIILVVSLIITLILVPLSRVIIRLASIEDVSSDTILYFRMQLIELAIVALNTMFIGLEKAKGNSKSILFLNMLVLVVKLILTVIFVYGLRVKSIIYIELSTIIGQLVLLIIGLFIMFGKKNIIRISIKDFSIRWKYSGPILALSLPIFFGKFVMSLGKVAVNSLCGHFYNDTTDSLIVGALAVSNHLSGLVTTPTNAFEEGGSTIVSQNLGTKNIKRAIKAFWCNLLLVSIVSLVGFVLVRIVFLDKLVELFNYKGSHNLQTPEEIAKSAKLVQYIKEVFRYDCISILVLGVTSAILGLLYGFGQTYLSGILNFSRIGTRIITLLICHYGFKMDYRAAGVSMGISNAIILLISIGFLVFFLLKIKRHGYKDMKLSDPEPSFVELDIE